MEPLTFGDNDKSHIIQNIICEEMAVQGLIPVSYAIRDV